MKTIEKFEAGRYEQQYQYKSFLPNPVNHEWRFSDPEIMTLLGEANRLLGELNAFSQLLPDVDFFIQMHIRKEATTSSRIEGTQTSMEETLVKERDINPERRDDWREVQNYVQAVNHAMEQLHRLPLSNRLLKEIHSILLKGVRGKQKQPGDFRSSQNWIGSSLNNAIFIPPHYKHLPELMSDLENFLHNDRIHVPHLIKIAIIHYQFETIHPFLDGNGRLGRLLIVLYLVNFGLLVKPAFYLSDFFERNKSLYYEKLMAVRTVNDMLGWLRFFLQGLKETAAASIQVFKEIIGLKERIEREKMPLFNIRRQTNAQTLMHQLYQTPVMSIKDIANLLGTQPNTASRLVDDFVELGILRELSGRKRNRLFIFDNYSRIFTE